MQKSKSKKQKISQGIYGINAKKSRIIPVKNSSDISTKVKSIIVK
jgi:hypothetical protein